MTNETIVAVYDTAADAVAAVQDLEDAGIPSNAISRHAEKGMSSIAPSSETTERRVSGPVCSAANPSMRTTPRFMTAVSRVVRRWSPSRCRSNT
jgi:hypothetical protein